MEKKLASKNLKNTLIVFFMILLATTGTGYACQISVNDNHQKNQLVAEAANELGLSLASMTSTALTGYSRSLEGSDAYDCPLFLVTQARIAFEYAPKRNETCSAAVTVTYRQYVGEITPELDVLLFETITTGVEMACSTSGVIVRAQAKFPRFPRLPKRPITIKPVK